MKTKGLIQLALTVLVVAAVATNASVKTALRDKFDQYFYPSVCSQPIRYKLGTVDPRFGLSVADFLADTKEAAKIWDKASGGAQLLAYDPSETSTLTINLVYDKRSALTNQVNNLEGQVKTQDQSLQPQIDNHNQEAAAFKQKAVDFNNQVNDLNQQISDWNAKGGAPADVYQQLIQKQNDLKTVQGALQAEADKLNQEAKYLNLSTQDYNSSVYQLNQTISNLDQALLQKPEEGLYNPAKETIDIYFDNNYNELIHTLAHEMGHSLGLGHNQNRLSIMYPYSTQVTIPSSDDIASLNEVCAQHYITAPWLKYFKLM